MEEQQNFLYEYTKFCLEQAQHGVDTVGTKLTGVMEISALLLLLLFPLSMNLSKKPTLAKFT